MIAEPIFAIVGLVRETSLNNFKIKAAMHSIFTDVVNEYTNKDKYTHAHTYTHTYTHIHTHIHMHT
jgi:hypothetical protein